MFKFFVMILWVCCGVLPAFGQLVLKDSAKVKITIKGLFQSRYSFSSHKNIDVTGLHHTDGKAADNDFDIKRARLQFTSEISDRTAVVLLLNLADFKSDPKNKVLENAYITYRMNRFVNLKTGQFRPAFGLEDMYPVDVIKSLDYSNQYTAFGNNGWQSFQIGVSVFGAVQGKIPVKYEVSVVNGNNRNQIMDNDNGKHFLSRIELLLEKRFNVKLGINTGMGLVFDKKVYASGLDLSTVIPLAGKWSMILEAEIKQGNNHVLFASLDSASRQGNVSAYQMRGIYILPNLRYAINYHRLSSLELSCRYENFDKDFKRHGSDNQSSQSARSTWTPMISAEFLKTYNARIQIGANIDFYKKNIAATTQFNNSLFIVQIQSRL
jgi:hypothetical protein